MSRLTNDDVQTRFMKYGYALPDNFVHRNVDTKYEATDLMTGTKQNLSVRQLNYRISRGRSQYTPPVVTPTETPFNIFEMFFSEPTVHRSSEQRFNRNYGIIDTTNTNNTEYIVTQKDQENAIKKLKRYNDFELSNANNKSLIAYISGYIIAKNKINKNIRMTISSPNNTPTYLYLNPNTADILLGNLIDNTYLDEDIGDSSNKATVSFMNMDESFNVKFEFIDRKDVTSGRINGGFFPYVNKSAYNLDRYGIFNTTTDVRQYRSCLAIAFQSSNLFTDKQLNEIESSIVVRNTPRSVLTTIANQFNLYITMYYDAERGISHTDYGNKSNQRLKLYLLNGHWMIYDTIMVDEKKISIGTLLKRLIAKNELIPMTDDEVTTIIGSFKVTPQRYTFERPVMIKQAVERKIKLCSHGKGLFGYTDDTIDENSIDERLADLQQLVNNLGLDIPVRSYYKFSNLMQVIMSRYGCYDGVVEYSGIMAKQVRQQLEFPKTTTTDGKPFYSNEEMYYIDLNGAYMSVIDSIPLTIDEDSQTNDKIKELIHKLYEARIKAKQDGNINLANTIKFMMTSCWGSSIRRNKTIKHKRLTNTTVDTYNQYIVKYDDRYVAMIEPYYIQYTHPQFARQVLKSFKQKMDYIKSLVTVYYENIDALLISKSDYMKLYDMGLIRENELGYFKLDKVFTEIACYGKRQYVGTLNNGQQYYHCIKGDYNKIVDTIKSLV